MFNVPCARKLALLTASVLSLSPSAHAQDECRTLYDDRTLRWIVPFSVGGGYDTLSRLIAPLMEARLGTNIVVENRVGAGSLIGSRAIRSARPDGNTIGILNVSGLLVADLIGMADVPDVVADYTIIGRVATTHHVWATSGRHGFRSIDEAIDAGEAKGLVTGVRDVAASAFVDFTVGTYILGVDGRAVVGYTGTPDGSMAAIRGDVDLVVGNFDSLRGWLERGDLRPLLQISDERISALPLLDGVPLLAGRGGVAERRAIERGLDVDEALEDAAALNALLAGARIVAAPRGLDHATVSCLRRAFDEALYGDELATLVAASNLTLNPAPAGTVEADLSLLAGRLDRFEPVIRAAVMRMRR